MKSFQIWYFVCDAFEVFERLDFVVVEVEGDQIGDVLFDDVDGGDHNRWSEQSDEDVPQIGIVVEFGQIECSVDGVVSFGHH